jgi:hypothetical protein
VNTERKPLNGEQRQQLRDLLRSPGWAIVAAHLERRRAAQAENALNASCFEDVKYATGYASAIDDLLHYLTTESVEKNPDGSPRTE